MTNRLVFCLFLTARLLSDDAQDLSLCRCRFDERHHGCAAHQGDYQCREVDSHADHFGAARQSHVHESGIGMALVCLYLCVRIDELCVIRCVPVFVCMYVCPCLCVFVFWLWVD